MRASDGLRLRAALFAPAGPVRGPVVLSPGRTEPIEKYFEVVDELNGRGFAVLVHDWRGQGLSDRLHADPHRGHARGWRPFLDDYRTLLDGFTPRLPKPWIAMGHSMGGGLTGLALAEGERRFSGAIFSAPMMGVHVGERSRAGAAALAGCMAKTGRAANVMRPVPDPFHHVFDENILTHDRGRFDRFSRQMEACPELALGGVTWGWLDFAMSLERRIARAGVVERLTLPLVVLAAGEEQLVHNAASRRFAQRAPNGRFVEVDGAYHEILMETDARRAVFWAEFDALARQVAATPGTSDRCVGEPGQRFGQARPVARDRDLTAVTADGIAAPV